MENPEFFKRFKGRVIVYVQNKHFDCVGKILEVSDHKKGIRVQVKKYLNGDWSKDEQFYHFHEITRIIPIGRSMKTIEVLFGSKQT